MRLLFVFLFAALVFLPVGTIAHADTPIADSHIHYNWDHAEIISPEEVVAKMKKAGLGLAIVSSTPSHLVLELKKHAGDWLIPFFSPYIHELGKKDWYLDDDVISQAEVGLSQGLYAGIGEIHFFAGFPPNPDNKIFLQLMALAKRYDVPALIHVDAGSENFFLNICRQHPAINIQFAHAGGNLSASHIHTILETCPSVWVDLSARDPWRYGGLTGENGLLEKSWHDLILRYPDRFIIGTDPVWRVTRTQSWDLPDDGWDHFEQLLRYHLHWLSDLPDKVQAKILWKNVANLIKFKVRRDR